MRRTLRRGILVAPVVFIAALLFFLFVMPQSFTATASVSVQQPGASSGGIVQALSGGTGSTKRYVGILRSRLLARQVAEKSDLMKACGFRTLNGAIRYLREDGMKVRDDTTQGLVFVDVTLPGPPLMRTRPGDRERVSKAAAAAADVYVDALQRYYTDSDNERELVLLRTAEERLKDAQRDYQKAVEDLQAYIRKLRNVGYRSGPTADPFVTAGIVTATISQELPGLYTTLANVEQDLTAKSTEFREFSALTEDQLKNLDTLPLEDELLTGARRRVSDELMQYENLRIQYGEQHPQVNAARERLRIAREALRQQAQSVRDRRTSQANVRKAELAALQERRRLVLSQIADAEARLNLRRERAMEYDALRNRVVYFSEVLRVAGGETARLRLTTTAANSRIAVVDRAQVPEKSAPGMGRIGVYSVLLALLALVADFGIAYAANKGSLSNGGGTNG